VSKLIRVCQSDRKFYSYAEAALKCQYNMQLYNWLQTAYLSKPGTSLAKVLGIPGEEDVLFGMFGYRDPDTPEKNNKGSAMCIFPGRLIRRVFTRNTQKCFNGIGRTGPDHIAAPRNCQPTVCACTYITFLWFLNRYIVDAKLSKVNPFKPWK
jgi:plexin A